MDKKKSYVSLEIEFLEVQMEKGYAASDGVVTGGGFSDGNGW